MVKFYRWVVFLLAAGYCIRTIVFNDLTVFGGSFRFLTIWALFLSFFCASRMMALEEGRSDKRWDGLVSATAVINAMVVGLYWRLYFADPMSVTTDGELGEPYLELYLHGLGPALQWIDATFIHRAFRRWKAAVLWLCGIIGLYVAWTEGLVQWLNATPRGNVTNGLPYPFLNNMVAQDRLVFYSSNLLTAVILLAIFAAIAWAVRRWLPARQALAAPLGSPDSAG